MIAEEPAVVKDTEKVELSELEWRVLTALKREFAPDEITRDLWRPRAAQAVRAAPGAPMTP